MASMENGAPLEWKVLTKKRQNATRGIPPGTESLNWVANTVVLIYGGDFFEHVELPSGGIGIALGDVSGRGPSAALFTSMLQGIFACEVEAGRGPAETKARINRLLLKRGVEARFATFFYAVLKALTRPNSAA